MAPAPTPTNPTLLHEEASQRELATTQVPRPLARFFALAFCLALFLPAAIELLQRRPGEDPSVLKKWVQPRLQSVLTSAGGFGNEKVTIGRDGWLYYAPGLRYIFGHPFLDASYLKAKAKAMIDKEGLAVAHPDPLPAFRQLAADCRRLGIDLLLVPVPDKGMIVRDPLGATGLVQNPDFAHFRSEIEAAGATVLHVESLIHPEDAPWFLKQDTHWTPRFMDRVAQAVAAHLKPKVHAEPTPQFLRKPATAASHGDLVAMLQLPVDQTLFSRQSVEIEPIEPIGAPAQPEVLLLGDSFTNIYSSSSLDWGQKAGLGEHIAYHLNAPVDILALNGAGSNVRNELLRAANTGRLAATRALVYEFAIRDLYLEDWPVVALGALTRRLISRTAPKRKEDLTEPDESAPPPPPTPDSDELELRGTLVQLSRPINPGSAPYEDALLYAKIKVDSVEKGVYDDPEAIVAFHAMQKRVLLPGASHKLGAHLHLRLIKLRLAPEEVRTIQRSDDIQNFDLVPYFVKEEIP